MAKIENGAKDFIINLCEKIEEFADFEKIGEILTSALKIVNALIEGLLSPQADAALRSAAYKIS